MGRARYLPGGKSVSCQTDLECWRLQECGQLCGPPPPTRRPPLRQPGQPWFSAPCSGFFCGAPAPLPFTINVSCAPCENGTIPAMPDCQCGCRGTCEECCQTPDSCPLFPVTEHVACENQRATLFKACLAECPTANPQGPPRTIPVTAPSPCGPGEHPAPCDIGEALDLATGCCALPSNVLVI